MTDPQPTAPQRAVMPAHAARRLLELEAETRFTLKDGRIASEAPPDNAPGPLLYMAGGRIWVDETVAPPLLDQLSRLARHETPGSEALLPLALIAAWRCSLARGHLPAASATFCRMGRRRPEPRG